MSKVVAAVLLTILARAAVAFAQSAPAPGGLDKASQVDAIFKDFDKPTSPGCAVGVYQDDRVVYQRAYGMANLDHDVALTPASVFHVASVSKQFTAAAILLLAQDGKLSIDDDIRKYVPEIPALGPTITIRHLANHTSGIRDQWSLLGLAGWRYSRDLITDDDVLAVLARQKELNFTPGERHLYSNSGYTLLALIVSRVSGQSFRDFTTNRIFKPLGMVNTHFRDNFSEIVKNQAYGYSSDQGTFRLSVTNFDTAGATSLLTTVEDMARWHANFDGRAVGGDRLIAGLLERGVLNDGRKIDYAFGLAHGTYRGLPTVSHGGSDAGYRSAFLRFPDQRFGVAALCNVATGNPGQLSQRVADVYLAQKLSPRGSDTSEDAAEVPMPATQLARYAGLYMNQADWVARRFVLENGKLFAVVGNDRAPMTPIGGEQFQVTTPAGRLRLTFENRPDGSVGRVRSAPGPADVYERVQPFVPTPGELGDFAGVYRSDEMDAVFRVTVVDGQLRLERMKSRTTALEPLVTDTFTNQAGTFRFVRNATGQVTGFTLEAGRVVGMKFWKDTRPPRPPSF